MASTDSQLGEIRILDDFDQHALNADFWLVNNANSGTNFAINLQANGVIRGTVTSNSSNDMAVFYSPAIFRASSGFIEMEARVSIITSLLQLVFIGWSDEKKAELPLDYNGSTFTSTASNAVGFYYAGGVASTTWRYGGVKADSDSTQAAADAKYNPVAATFQTFKVSVNADGAASFYIDGNIIKENLANAVTASTLLLTHIGHADDGAAGSLDVDYVRIRCARV